MPSIRSHHLPDENVPLFDFIDSETEKVFMVIGAEEIDLEKFMRRQTEAFLEKDTLLVFRYDIWPQEHSHHFLYRWLVETASGLACRDAQAWAAFIAAHPDLKNQLMLLEGRDQRPFEVRFIEAIRFIAEKMEEGNLILHFVPFVTIREPALVDFFKSTLRILPPKTKMVICQCIDDVLAAQDDFCPSNRIVVNETDSDETLNLLACYRRCYRNDDINGTLMRAMSYLAHPLTIQELSIFTGVAEEKVVAALSSSAFEGMLTTHGDGRLGLAYPRLFHSRDETLHDIVIENKADMDKRVLAHYRDRLDKEPGAFAALAHSLGIYRSADSPMAVNQALAGYGPKLSVGAGELSEMELQHVLERFGNGSDQCLDAERRHDLDTDATRGRLLLALGEVKETLGRNRAALEVLNQAIDVLRKSDLGTHLQKAYELQGRSAFALRDIETARSAFKEALTVADELKRGDLIADILSQSAYLEFSVKQLDTAEKQYREALEQYRLLEDVNRAMSCRGKAAQYSNLGHVAYAKGNFEKAETHHLKAIEIYKLLPDDKRVASQWGYVGHIHFAKGNYKKAVTAYEQAAEYDENAGEPLMAAQRYANMGHTLYALRKPETAEAMFNTALERYSAVGDVAGEAAQLSNLGLVKGDQGKFDEAGDFFNRAKKMYEELGDFMSAVSQVMRLGHVSRGRNDLKTAGEHYRNAMARYREFQYGLGEGEAAMELGQVDMALEDFDKAVVHFNSAKELFAGLGHGEKETMCLVLLAQVHKAQGDMDAAEAMLSRAYRLCRKIKNDLGLANVAHQIGLLNFDRKHYDGAEGNFRKALSIFREKSDREGEANLLANLGTLYYETKKLDQAREQFEAALILLRKMEHPVGVAGVQVNMSFVHEDWEDYDSARNVLKEALNLYRQMKMTREAEDVEKRLETVRHKTELSLKRIREQLLSMNGEGTFSFGKSKAAESLRNRS